MCMPRMVQEEISMMFLMYLDWCVTCGIWEVWPFTFWWLIFATEEAYGERVSHHSIATSSCERCIFGKHHRHKFVSGVSYKEKAPLKLIHTNLCWPMKTHYLTGNVYFMTFIDDFSWKTWVYLLKHKSQAFECV